MSEILLKSGDTIQVVWPGKKEYRISNVEQGISNYEVRCFASAYAEASADKPLPPSQNAMAGKPRVARPVIS